METLLVILLFLWLPLAVAAPILMLMLMLVRRKPAKVETAYCPFCGYDRRGDYSYLCPECGKHQPHPDLPRAFCDSRMKRAFLISRTLLVLAAGLHVSCLFQVDFRSGRAPFFSTIAVPFMACMIAFFFAYEGLQQARERGSAIWKMPVLIMILSWAATIYLALLSIPPID